MDTEDEPITAREEKRHGRLGDADEQLGASPLSRMTAIAIATGLTTLHFHFVPGSLATRKFSFGIYFHFVFWR